jgi:hypothetical protein
MLSPNAMKLVRVSSGGVATISGNPQLAETAAVSVAVHVTGVVPIGKTCPEPGVHTTRTGACPPFAAASG